MKSELIFEYIYVNDFTTLITKCKIENINVKIIMDGMDRYGHFFNNVTIQFETPGDAVYVKMKYL